MEKIEEYNRFKNLIINVMANQWTPLGSADKAFIAKYFNETVIPQLPKGEPLLKCTSCSSAFWNAVKTSVNFINHMDKKLEAEVLKSEKIETKDEQHNEGEITGGDIGKEINTKPTVNKKRSKK